MNAERARKDFDEAMAEAQSATNNAVEELMAASYASKVNARYARMYAYKLQKTIKNLSHAPNLAVSPERDTTKEEGAWPLDLDYFDENDGETESERRMWAARDAYDMREGK